MAASKSMGTGDWQACVKYINAIKVWDHLPNSSNVKKMLNRYFAHYIARCNLNRSVHMCSILANCTNHTDWKH